MARRIRSMSRRRRGRDCRRSLSGKDSFPGPRNKRNGRINPSEARTESAGRPPQSAISCTAAKKRIQGWGGRDNLDQFFPCNLPHAPRTIRLRHSATRKIPLSARKPVRRQGANRPKQSRKRSQPAKLLEAGAQRRVPMARPRSLRRGRILETGFDLETLELQHNALRNSRLIPVQFNVAALARE